LFLLFFSIAQAQAMPRYEADESVDVTAQNVTEAKKKAMSQAIRDGINEVALGISTDRTIQELNKLNDNQLQHFITEVMVLMEKTSDVRYIADLRINVDGELLKAYILENNLPLVISGDADVTVIPLLEREDGSLDVWSDDNIWRQAFLEKPKLHKHNMRVQIIDKNLGNIAAIKPNRVFDLAEAEYKDIMDFNRADALYVLKYSLKDKTVYMKEYPDLYEDSIQIGENDTNSMVDKVLSYFKVQKKETVQNIEENTNESLVEVVYTYAQLSDWMALKKILEDNPQVQNIQLISMGNGKVHFNFQYGGHIEKLQGILSVNGYTMRNEGEYYAIN
jgi:hypothetical protein